MRPITVLIFFMISLLFAFQVAVSMAASPAGDVSIRAVYPKKLVAGKGVIIKAVVRNKSRVEMECPVVFSVSGEGQDEIMLRMVPGGMASSSFLFVPRTPGIYTIRLEVGTPPDFQDIDPLNNALQNRLTVLQPPLQKTN